MRQLALFAVAGCAAAVGPTPYEAAWVADTSSFAPGVASRQTSPVADHYRNIAGKIVAAARVDRGAYAKLSELTDHIGHRLSGSLELDRAIAWASQAMRDDGHDVRTEKVMVPHWVRGAEDAAIVAPIARPLTLIGLGGTVATPKAGITAPVVVVHDWTELAARRDAVKGAIVVYNVPMPAWTEAHGARYGDVVEYRTLGPSRAARLGAVATLVRSVTAHSLHTPHTGALQYEDGAPKLPAAAVTVEDAALLDRLAARSSVTVHLHLESQQLPDAPSANVIGELRGANKPEEVVVISGHLDSWDVGQGAHDDGAGAVTAMQAITVLRRLHLVPRRTIRAVLWTNEENGLRGARTYVTEHAAELAKTVLALESDSGGFTPRGFSIQANDAAAQKRVHDRIAEIASLLRDVGVTRITDGHAGADIGFMASAGVPLVGLDVDNRLYFDYHHTQADTLDKVDPQQLADDVAVVAVLAYIAADLPDRIDAL
jgi:carboxypeptidase Q